MTEESPTYDKEQFWLICKEAKPELTREEFEGRWFQLVTITNMMGLWRKV